MVTSSDTSVGLWITYVIVFFVPLVWSIVNFVQSFKLKNGRITHMILFAMVACTAFCYSIGRVFEADLVPYAKVNIYFVTAPPAILGAESWLLSIGYAFQDSIIVYLLFMWVEVFVTYKTGNLEQQTKIARRYAIIRSIIVVIMWNLTFWTIYVAYTYQGANIGNVDLTVLWIGTACIGVVILPILILAAYRWKSLYQQITTNVNSRARLRFADLTKASVSAIFSFVMNQIFFGVLNLHLVSGDIATYVLTSLIPDSQILFAVCWFFSPSRKFQYADSSEDSSATIGSSQKPERASGVISDGGTVSATSDKLTDSMEVMDREMEDRPTGIITVVLADPEISSGNIV